MAKQKDGRYRTGVVVGHDANGKPITKWVSGRTKKELEAAKEEALKTYVYGAADVRREITFDVYAQEWYDAYKRPHLSESSKRSYDSIFTQHLFPRLAGRQIRAISAPELQQLLNGMQGMSRTVLGYVTTILRGVFSMAYANGIIDRDPTVALKRPAATREHRRALTAAETAAALRVGHEHPEGLLLLILYYTGARRGEALGLQWGDIDFERRMIAIRRDIDFVTAKPGELKTAFSEREVPMPDELAEALRPIRGIGGTYVIQSPQTGTYLSQATYTRRWRRLMEAMYAADPSIEAEGTEPPAPTPKPKGKPGPAPKPPVPRSILTAHYFRHNYATVLYNAGVDVLAAQKFMGHADVKTTLSIYSHLADELKINSAEKVRDAFKNSANAKKEEKTIFAKSLPARGKEG